jgi:NIMA (never in mitosis gene a)-related kinase
MLADFEIVKTLGRGSFGITYLVKRMEDSKMYCMKQVDLANLTEIEQKNTVKEVFLLASLSSIYVIRYYESSIEEDKLNIIMEYAVGGNLEEFIKKKKKENTKLDENTIWKFFFELCLGLLRFDFFFYFTLILTNKSST